MKPARKRTAMHHCSYDDGSALFTKTKRHSKAQHKSGTKSRPTPKNRARRTSFSNSSEDCEDCSCTSQGCVLLILCGVLFLVVPLLLWRFISSDEEYKPVEDRSKVPDMLRISNWGQRGQGVKVNPYFLTEVHRLEYESDYSRYGYNKFVSDRISGRRFLPDVRHIRCLELPVATSQLPQASVVILFRDEARSVLLRAVYSVLDRTPHELLKEIILVQHGATSEGLHHPVLESYLSIFPKIKVHRLGVNHTLTFARGEAARLATGAVLVFLNGRCEVTSGWLEPLLMAVEKGSRDGGGVIATPSLDTVHYDTFEFLPDSEAITPIFTWDWSLTTRKTYVQTPTDRQSIATPTLGHVIMAVSRQSFQKLLGFLPQVTNGSALELSLRCWLCGCRIETVSCSRVGLIYRSLSHRYQLSDEDRPWLTHKERLDIAHEWLVGWEKFVKSRRERAQIRKRLLDLTPRKIRTSDPNCKNFGWYVTHVHPVLWSRDEAILQSGVITSMVFNRTLLHLHLKGTVVHLVEWYQAPGTVWYYTESSHVRTEDNLCLGGNGSSPNVSVQACVTTHSKGLGARNLVWKLQQSNSSFQVIHAATQLCLTWQMSFSQDTENSTIWFLQLRQCKAGLSSQSWFFSKTQGSSNMNQLPSNLQHFSSNVQHFPSYLQYQSADDAQHFNLSNNIPLVPKKSEPVQSMKLNPG